MRKRPLHPAVDISPPDLKRSGGVAHNARVPRVVAWNRARRARCKPHWGASAADRSGSISGTGIGCIERRPCDPVADLDLVTAAGRAVTVDRRCCGRRIWLQSGHGARDGNARGAVSRGVQPRGSGDEVAERHDVRRMPAADAKRARCCTESGTRTSSTAKCGGWDVIRYGDPREFWGSPPEPDCIGCGVRLGECITGVAVGRLARTAGPTRRLRVRMRATTKGDRR